MNNNKTIDGIVTDKDGNELWCKHELPHTDVKAECLKKGYCHMQIDKGYETYCKRYVK